MRSSFLLIGGVLLFAQFSWAEGKCLAAGAKMNCEIRVGSAAEWNAIDADIANCMTTCGTVDTAKIVLTSNISFGDKVPDNLCSANVVPVKSFTDFIVTSEGKAAYTLSNGCLINDSDKSFALFANSNLTFDISRINFENFYVDAKSAENAAFVLARSDRKVNVEAVSLKNISLKSDFGSKYTGLLVGASGTLAGSVGVTVSNVKGDKLLIVSESTENVGGLVGYSETAVSLNQSNIDIEVFRNRASEITDGTSSVVAGLVGTSIARVYVLQDTISINVSAVDVHDASSIVGGLVGFGAGSTMDFVMTKSVVTGSVNVYSKKNDPGYARERVLMGGLVGCWSIQSGASNFNVLEDSVVLDVFLSGAASKLGYVGGLLGHADALGSSDFKMNFENVSFNGKVYSEDSQLEKVYAGGILGGFVASKNANLSMESVRINTLVSNDGLMSNIFMGGMAGLIENVSDLKITKSYAWGLDDNLLYAKASGGTDISYYVGGIVGFLNKARSSEISNAFARGAIAVYGGKNNGASAGKTLAGIAGLVENESAKTKINDVYYIGEFGLTSNAKSGTYVGLAYASDDFVDLNAAYAVEFNGVATSPSNVNASGTAVTVSTVDASVASQNFTDRLNEFDDAWVWSDTLNEGLPQLKFFAGIDGGKFDPDDPENPEDPDDPTPMNPVDSLPFYVQVFTSGNVAKMSVEFYDIGEEDETDPVYVRLLDKSGMVVFEKLLAKSVKSQKYSEDFGQLPGGEYVVEICSDSVPEIHCSKIHARTESWKVQEYVNQDVPGHWQMVSLSSIESGFTRYDEGEFFRWDEYDAVGEYWQYKAYDGIGAAESEGGWFYAASGIKLPARKYELKSESDSLVWNLKSKYSGWNIVANPYPWKIYVDAEGDFDDAENGAEPMWFWNSETESYEAVDTLPAFGAFWLYSGKDNVSRKVCAAPVFSERADIEFGSKRVPAPPSLLLAGVDARGALTKKTDGSSWSVRLVLEGDDGSVDRWNVIGVGSREISIEEPPAGMGRGVSLSIVDNGNGRVFGKSLAKSVVATLPTEISEGPEYNWTVAMSSGNDGEAKLSVEGLKTLESFGFKALLELNGRSYELKAGSGVNVKVSAENTYARIRIVPSGARIADSSAKISRLGFTNVGSSLNVSFFADETIAESKYEVRLVSLSGRTVERYSGSVRNGTNSLDIAVPDHGGVYILNVRVASESRSVRIRI